jgi:hypothetical protein
MKCISLPKDNSGRTVRHVTRNFKLQYFQIILNFKLIEEEPTCVLNNTFLDLNHHRLYSITIYLPIYGSKAQFLDLGRFSVP